MWRSVSACAVNYALGADWNLPADPRYKLLRPDWWNDKVLLCFGLDILFHQVALSMAVWVYSVAWLVGSHNLCGYWPRPKPINNLCHTVGAIMGAGMTVIMAAMWRRTSWSSHSHQIWVPVHFVGAFALRRCRARTGPRGWAVLLSQAGARWRAWAGARGAGVDVLEARTQLTSHSLPTSWGHTRWCERRVCLRVPRGWGVAACWAQALRLTVDGTIQTRHSECRPGTGIHQRVMEWVGPMAMMLTWWCDLNPGTHSLGPRSYLLYVIFRLQVLIGRKSFSAAFSVGGWLIQGVRMWV